MRTLTPSLAAHYDPAESTGLLRNGCIPNTRVNVLKHLIEWAEDTNSGKIYWLNGMAGTGKSAIAYSLCKQLESNLTLAASFFCSRQLEACRNVNLIIPTIAYRLARFSPPFRQALSRALEQTPDVHALKVSEQFRKLIIEPLKAKPHAKHADLVVVIDALDECDSKIGVEELLRVLILHTPEVPIKFIVTSRPETGLQHQMRVGQSEGVPEQLVLHNIESSVVREDIKTYLKAKLDFPKLALDLANPDLEKLTLTDADLEKLVDQSGVLFIYAATVVRYIEYEEFSWSTDRLAQVLAASISLQRDSTEDLDILYGDILKAVLEAKGRRASERQRMRDVLHTVICAQEPMTFDVLAGLLQLNAISVQAALRPLSSVLNLPSDVNGAVTTLHKSFPDYMLDKHRSKVFSCDARVQNGLLAQRCFELMRTPAPPFNICSLESSYVFDKDVPDIDQKIKTAISDEMFYACRYWGAHLMHEEPSLSLMDCLHDFFSVRLLLWMEVMNLKECMPAGVKVLHWMQSWLQVGDDTMHALLRY